MTAHRLATAGPVIIDTPGFRSETTLACLAVTDFVLVPVKPSPFDVDRMLDTLNLLINGASSRRPPFRCLLTQTTRDSIIAKQIREELAEAGFPVLKSEMTNRVVYAEAALWGATPSLIDRIGARRARDRRDRRGGRWIARAEAGGGLTWPRSSRGPFRSPPTRCAGRPLPT